MEPANQSHLKKTDQRGHEGPVIEFLPDADAIERDPMPAYIRSTLWVMAGALVCFLAWASFSEVETVVVAQGRLVNPMPNIVADNTLPSPQTSYGTHKLMLEYLLADFTRKGYVDGRAARLMTVTVRPGKPNGAASSFFSGIIREPLSGQESICPVDENVSHSVSSPNNTIKCLIAVFEASREAMQGRLALNLPGLNITVKEMLQALEEVAGPSVRQHVKFVRNEQIAGIVANWAKGGSAQRAAALGLKPDASFKDIIQQYIDDCQLPYYPSHALDGLKK
jgi:nucleoside-diphosphate-sugar epimerase